MRIWKHGRFAWPLVLVIGYHALFLLAFDYLWRELVVPFEFLLLVGVLVWLAGLACIAAGVRRQNAT